jgi:hypothetical protein
MNPVVGQYWSESVRLPSALRPYADWRNAKRRKALEIPAERTISIGTSHRAMEKQTHRIHYGNVPLLENLRRMRGVGDSHKVSGDRRLMRASFACHISAIDISPINAYLWRESGD